MNKNICFLKNIIYQNKRVIYESIDRGCPSKKLKGGRLLIEKEMRYRQETRGFLPQT